MPFVVTSSQRAAAQSPYAGEKVQGLLSAADEKPADASVRKFSRALCHLMDP